MSATRAELFQMAQTRDNAVSRGTPEAVTSLPTIRALPSRVRSAVLDRAVIRSFLRNGPIFWQGDELRHLPVIVSGHAKLQRNTEHGREVVVDVLGPGDAACWDSVLHAEPVPGSLVALEPIEVAFLPCTPVRMAVSTVPGCALAYTRQASEGRRRLIDQIASTRAASVPARVGGLLLHLLSLHGDPTSGRLPVRLSRQDLADAAGTTVETAIRLMRRWEAEGLVTSLRHGFDITDAEGLARAIE